MRIIIVVFLITAYSCQNQNQNASLSKKKFNDLVTASLDSLSKDDFLGINNLEIIIPTKDTILTTNNINFSCFYKRFYALVSFYNSKTTLAIDVIGMEESDSIRYLYKYDDNLLENKLEGRYIPILINNVFYRVSLGSTFDQATILLLNIKIKLLECYIFFLNCY